MLVPTFVIQANHLPCTPSIEIEGDLKVVYRPVHLQPTTERDMCHNLVKPPLLSDREESYKINLTSQTVSRRPQHRNHFVAMLESVASNINGLSPASAANDIRASARYTVIAIRQTPCPTRARRRKQTLVIRGDWQPQHQQQMTWLLADPPVPRSHILLWTITRRKVEPLNIAAPNECSYYVRTGLLRVTGVKNQLGTWLEPDIPGEEVRTTQK